MKKGIVRKLDHFGRIVIPSEYRNAINLNIGDKAEIFIEADHVVIIPVKKGCMICHRLDHLVELKNNLICTRCISELSALTNTTEKNTHKENSNG